ncbi:MAG: MoaD/ThiS family protein [marine benthic group bacterium]|jgi:molybdopterin converting factor subunit 1|nr:MoaD/ThiS family protein [Gemmatimonadota bacterium]MCL7961683.1 MoaD/ThiS family protein [Candidatus Carthagonibacter metallireducens]MCL7937544.1 MoaD/ThiS family protein [Gemmatimonadota bacterium]MCL7957096.1 MoaD/ThiS family protein [Gemmatimonadota bacterium]MCL7964350.1 MoaD/ThiS family protein [Gemmatimonadota bacterium]
MTAGEFPVRVMLFGHYRELVGAPSLDLTLPDGAKVEDLVTLLRDLPVLAELPERPAVAVNRQYAAAARALARGDEIALIPPVAGG